MANLLLPDISKSVQIPPLATLARSGVYSLLKDEVVVYVGQAVDMRRRVAMHIGEGSKDFDTVAFVPCKPEKLLERERLYIEKLVPKYNVCSVAKAMRFAGVESDTGGKLVGTTRKVRIPRANARRTITVFA